MGQGMTERGRFGKGRIEHSLETLRHQSLPSTSVSSTFVVFVPFLLFILLFLLLLLLPFLLLFLLDWIRYWDVQWGLQVAQVGFIESWLLVVGLEMRAFLSFHPTPILRLLLSPGWYPSTFKNASNSEIFLGK